MEKQIPEVKHKSKSLMSRHVKARKTNFPAVQHAIDGFRHADKRLCLLSVTHPDLSVAAGLENTAAALSQDGFYKEG